MAAEEGEVKREAGFVEIAPKSDLNSAISRDCGGATGRREVRGSSVGFVRTNALVSTNGLVPDCLNAKSGRQLGD